MTNEINNWFQVHSYLNIQKIKNLEDFESSNSPTQRVEDFLALCLRGKA